LVHAPLPKLALQGAQRQTVIVAKLVLSHSAGFEFNYQPLDLFTASPLAPATFLAFRHPYIPAKLPGP
jgi:hypothetical protein